MQNPGKQFQSQQQKKQVYKLHYFTKGDYSLFLRYAEGHPIHVKDRFSMGTMKIFSSTKHYYRQLFSDQLDQNSQWNSSFFYTLLNSFQNFQILNRNDENDSTLDFYLYYPANEEQGDIKKVIFQTTLEEDFSTDIQKQFWKQFQSYNDSKNSQIIQYEELSKQNAQNEQKKLETIKKFCSESQRQKKLLLGRLSAILTEKINKLREYEQDYKIQLFEDKLRMAPNEQNQRVMSTYQEQTEFAASLFKPSQDFR